MAASWVLVVCAIFGTITGSVDHNREVIPDASCCVTVTAYSTMGDFTSCSSGNGFLVSILDRAGQRHIFALTAAHVVAGCEWAKVTIRAAGLSNGLGRMDLSVDADPATFRTHPDELLDMVAICLDSALADDPEKEEVVVGMALETGRLSLSAVAEEGDTLVCLVRPIDPILWGHVGEPVCVPGVVMPGHPEDGTVWVDLYVDHGYSGSVMFADTGGDAGRPVVAGMLIARYLEIDDTLGPGSWLILGADPDEQDVLFGQMVPSVAILDLLRQ